MDRISCVHPFILSRYKVTGLPLLGNKTSGFSEVIWNSSGNNLQFRTQFPKIFCVCAENNLGFWYTKRYDHQLASNFKEESYKLTTTTGVTMK